MRYLLDVNALVALGIFHHVFHDRAIAWVTSLKGATLMTCSITELGFVRVAAQAPAYGFSVQQARTLLLSLKMNN
jgi:predicted nucleic acid-binding protein